MYCGKHQKEEYYAQHRPKWLRFFIHAIVGYKRLLHQHRSMNRWADRLLSLPLWVVQFDNNIIRRAVYCLAFSFNFFKSKTDCTLNEMSTEFFLRVLHPRISLLAPKQCKFLVKYSFLSLQKGFSLWSYITDWTLYRVNCKITRLGNVCFISFVRGHVSNDPRFAAGNVLKCIAPPQL